MFRGPGQEDGDHAVIEVWLEFGEPAPTDQALDLVMGALLGIIRALVGDGCVVGNSVELKNCILFDGVQVPHYNSVGDSVLGFKAHMGAGSITSNVKSDKTLVTVRCGEERIATGRKKLGAMLGDHAEIGCGSVLNPGAVIGRGSSVYPLSAVRGTVPAGSIYKAQGEVCLRDPAHG